MTKPIRPGSDPSETSVNGELSFTVHAPYEMLADIYAERVAFPLLEFDLKVEGHWGELRVTASTDNRGNFIEQIDELRAYIQRATDHAVE